MSATKVCPRCGEEYDEATSFCAKDGTSLVARGRSASDLVGSVIADRYRVVSKLGEGGMGQVYLAEHIRMKRKSAIKIMRPALVGDVDALQRFTREAENASQISHPNVAAIYDFGETSDNIVYLAMEYIDGEPLSVVIANELVLHPDVAADILGQAADALSAAHEMGILHRDLKPDNIMLGRRSDGTYMVKLVDFGIARTMERGEQRLTRTGFAVGTPEYMSPEQLAGDVLDARSDQYSLALVAFVALTGKDAFPSESSKESLVARLTSRPRTLQEAKQDVEWPDALQDIFNKALSPEASDRFDTVSDFAEALAGAIGMMTPSQTAALYRRALEQRLTNVAMRTPHADLASMRTPMQPQPTVSAGTSQTVSGSSTIVEPEPTKVAAPNLTRQKRKFSTAQLIAVTVGTIAAGGGVFAVLNLLVGAHANDAAVVPATSADSAHTLAVAASVKDSTALANAPQPTSATPAVPAGSTAAIASNAQSARAADSTRVALLRERSRKDSIARVEKAKRDSVARHVAAVEHFPDLAFTAGKTTPPDWKERSVRGSDLRVALLTPPVVAWRAEQARKWKETHVRSEKGEAYDLVDPLESWNAWKSVVSARRPVVVLEVMSERAPFGDLEPEKIIEFRRGDVQGVQLLKDGAPVQLLSNERYAAVVNSARYAELRKAVPHSLAAIATPETFSPRADGSWPKFELLVTDAMNRDKQARLQLSERMVRRIFDDFAPYRDGLKQ